MAGKPRLSRTKTVQKRALVTTGKYNGNKQKTEGAEVNQTIPLDTKALRKHDGGPIETG